MCGGDGAADGVRLDADATRGHARLRRRHSVSVAERPCGRPGKYTSGATCKVTGGTAKYKSTEEALVWKIKKFQGITELTLSAEVELVSTTTERKPWHKPPLSMDFHVPMFTASGLRVRFLKVWEKSGYQSTKWVRYLCNSGRDTKTGVYEVRCQ